MAVLEDRVALVTGAGSPTGIGLACARALGAMGATLALVSTTERIYERVDELMVLGLRARGFVADLTDESSVTAVVDALVADYGAVDVLVNNAGMTSVREPASPAGIDIETAPGFRATRWWQWHADSLTIIARNAANPLRHVRYILGCAIPVARPLYSRCLHLVI